ncbi:hypothetical protein PCANC_13388 [Puccinia coronata f. sp. avenae]|uniref:Uncharacterized protein n=1 Tax=Puccinia coronata f. sp. avenae TaxID=200324 RepID=A0A2N5VTN9_9BASI|nr:hypothetical protein PCANC_20062 [Puccinia coronata f. sp. avenae]PLW53360.1 hypothetical protein PCANC_13388 [Puccinia coronata f. sp. avenae]
MTICLPPPLIPEEPQTPEEPQVFLGKSILMSPPPVTASHLALVKSAATTASLCSAGKQCVRIAISWRGYDGSGGRNHKSGGAKQAASGGDSGNDDGGQEEQRRGWAGMMPALWYS